MIWKLCKICTSILFAVGLISCSPFEKRAGRKEFSIKKLNRNIDSSYMAAAERNALEDAKRAAVVLGGLEGFGTTTLPGKITAENLGARMRLYKLDDLNPRIIKNKKSDLRLSGYVIIPVFKTEKREHLVSTLIYEKYGKSDEQVEHIATNLFLSEINDALVQCKKLIRKSRGILETDQFHLIEAPRIGSYFLGRIEPRGDLKLYPLLDDERMGTKTGILVRPSTLAKAFLEWESRQKLAANE